MKTADYRKELRKNIAKVYKKNNKEAATILN